MTEQSNPHASQEGTTFEVMAEANPALAINLLAATADFRGLVEMRSSGSTERLVELIKGKDRDDVVIVLFKIRAPTSSRGKSPAGGQGFVSSSTRVSFIQPIGVEPAATTPTLPTVKTE